MRRSFGPKMGGGGGGGGGGGMMKTVHRAMRAGGIGGGTSQEPSYSSTRSNQQHINTTLSVNRPSSPCSSYLNHPAPDNMPPHNLALTTSLSPATGDQEFDWEYVEGDGDCDDDGDGFYDEFVFGGGVPSEQEVHRAVTSLHEVLEPVSFAQLLKHRETHEDDDEGVYISSPTGFHISGMELDWREPSMQPCYSTSALRVPSSHKVFDAFHMLQNNTSVQRMVISLSSDKAVWDAVMNNEVVRELRESISEDKSICDGSEGTFDDSNPVRRVLYWIFANTKDKVIEIVEKITKVVNRWLRPMTKDETSKRDANVGLDSFDEKLRSSFFISIVVLLIVVVSRSGKHR